MTPTSTPTYHSRISSAWAGRVSGCMLGKPVEMLSMRHGATVLSRYLESAGALPLRDYIPFRPSLNQSVEHPDACREEISKAIPDDDINYTVLALILLEENGLGLETEHVARAWLRLLPAGAVFTAERAAYTTLLNRAPMHFAMGAEPGFDLAECADNEFNAWIGAQIRADLYGWVCPGRPHVAARLARTDAALSHRGDGILGAVFVAALAAAIPATASLDDAIEVALIELPGESGAAEAVALGRREAGNPDGGAVIRARYADLSPVHTLNNLALVVWALLGYDEFGAATGEVVAAGLDTDCNGATVGGLWGLRGEPVPAAWTDPWQERVAVTLAGHCELALDDLVDRTVAVAEKIENES